jgi:hypothetical protein
VYPFFACVDCGLDGGETASDSIELIDFFGEIFKIMKLNCDLILRQVTAITQTISELGNFLPGPPEKLASLVGETIANYNPRSTAFARTETGRVSGHAEARVTLSKRHSFRLYVLFNSDEFDPCQLFWKTVGWEVSNRLSVRNFTFVGLATFLRLVIRLLKFLTKQIVLVISSHCSDIVRRDSCG